MTDVDENNNSNNVLQTRLAKVQTAIHKATQEAWKSNSARSPRSTVTTTTTDQDNASFLLGMDLFGQDTSTLERGIRDKLQDVEAELQRVLKLNDDSNSNRSTVRMNSEVVEETLDPNELAQQVQAYQHKISFLKEASLARSALDEAATLSSAALTSEPDLAQASDQLVQATQHYEQAQIILEQNKTTPQVSSSSSMMMQELYVGQQILEGLQHAIRRQRVELIHKASSVLDASVHVAVNELSVKSSSHLKEAYQVLEALEGGPLALEETLRRLTLKIYDQALSPLLEPLREASSDPTTAATATTNHIAPWKVTEKEDQPTKRIIGVSTSTTKGVVHRMEWHREEEIVAMDDDDATLEWPVGVWKDTLQVLQKILVFVQSKILLERERPCELVGTKLFGKPTALPSQLNLNGLGLESTLLGDDKGLLMEGLVHLMAKTCLPDALEASEITTLLPARGKELLHLCVPFCKDLVDRQLLARDPPPKLVEFCREFEQNYVEHRRCVLLNQARDILRNHDYHNTISVGVDEEQSGEDPTMAIFLLHRSSVSEVASQIMALLRQTMKESVQMPATPPTLRPTLYKTSREMLSLFRAIIPASHGHEVATVPRTAAVLHNDCIYFAHHCLTLGLEFKEKYTAEDARGKLLQQSCIFVDLVPLFRDLADQSMGDMLDVQADQLVDIVGSRITYLGQALQSNESLHEWSEAETALAAGIYHLRHLAQSWRPILSQRIFAQSMGHLADIVLTLYWKQVTPQSSSIVISANARHFLLGLFRKASEDLNELFGKGHSSSLPQRCIEDCSSEWGRFQALVQFLDMSNLTQVQVALANGVFRQVAGFELSRWIQAVYHEDRPERRILLQSLSSTAMS